MLRRHNIGEIEVRKERECSDAQSMSERQLVKSRVQIQGVSSSQTRTARGGCTSSRAEDGGFH
jgi:hypothetical protein